MKKRQIIIIGAALTILGLGYLLNKVFAGMKEEPKQMTIPDKKRFVKAEPIVYQEFEIEISSEGRVASNQYVDLISEVQGKILPGKLPLKKGQQFSTGDVLYRIYDEEATLALQAKKSKFLNSVALLLPDFKIDFPASYQTWYQFFNQISLDKPLPQMPVPANTQEKIYLANKSIIADYYGIQSDEIRLTKYTVTAPFTGSYYEVYFEAGSFANIGTRVARIVQTNKLELEVPLDILDAQWIKIGQRIKVFNQNKTKSWNAVVSRIAPFVDPKTQSLSTFLAIDVAPGDPILQGQYLVAVFDKIAVKHVMEIPRNAVFNFDEIFVVADGKLVKKHINIKKVNETSVFFDGLDEGTEIVIEPLINVVENMSVEIIRKSDKS